MDITRIIDLPSKTYIEEGDYIAIDNQQDGTQKVQFTNLFDSSLSQSDKIAPANTVGQQFTNTNTEITALRAAVGSPLKASTVAQMTDTNKIYVYTGSESGYTAGNWYYYNGTTWVSGGVYNSVAIETDKTLTVSNMAADAKVTGDEITDLKSVFGAITGNNEIPIYRKTSYIALSGSTVEMSGGTPQITGVSPLYNLYLVNCSAGDVFTISGSGGGDTRLWGFVDSSGNILSVATAQSVESGVVIVAPTNASWLIMHSRTDAKSYFGKILKDVVDGIDDRIFGNAIDAFKQVYSINVNGKWQWNAYMSSALIPVNPYDVIEIENTNVQSWFTVLSSAGNMSHGNTPDYATGYTNIVLYSSKTSFTVPSDGHYIWLYIFDGSSDYSPTSFTVNGYPMLNSVVDTISSIIKDYNPIDEYDIADGETNELTPFESTDLKYHKANREQKRPIIAKKIVAINHDDLAESDYVNIRKVYNKYGFNANFNLIVRPFATKAIMEKTCENVKELLADGNELGLHAIMNGSFWWMNKLFDINPDGGFTYAPTLSELKTDVGNGKNVFGQTINLDATLTSYGFVSLPTAYANTKISALSESDYRTIIGSYTWLFNTDTFSGIDLDGHTQNWRMIQWLEHWYNRLIDSSLGYSNIGDFATMYSNYNMTGALYPDTAHLANGKIVAWNDTTNPHYSDANYQKVGIFTKGLYKGASTCCNYEVQDRCIQIAKAFAKHYFGTDKFFVYGRHGVRYVDIYWKKDGYIPYDNRDLTILSGEFGKTYNSIYKRFESGMDVLLNNGIKSTNHHTPLSIIYSCQKSLYYGQDKLRYPFGGYADIVAYLVIAGANSGDVAGMNVSNADLIKILDEQDNPLKFVYENAGTTVTSSDGTASCYITTDIRNDVDMIRGCLATGKIPFLSVDTIYNNASNIYATELLLQYCYENDITVVPVEKARQIAVSTPFEMKQNMFPNPTFVSTPLIMFGGESASNRAYVPDGWMRYDGSLTSDVEVTNDIPTYSIKTSGTGSHHNYMDIWGLPSGKYQLSFYAKQTGESATIYVYKVKNRHQYMSGSYVSSIQPTSEFTKYTINFTVNEPTHNVPTDVASSIYSNGYGENDIIVRLLIGFNKSASGEETMSIYSPIIEPTY